MNRPRLAAVIESVPLMNLCETYLIKRGLSVEFARENGVEFDFAPQRDRIIERLGRACIPLWNLPAKFCGFMSVA
jgi:hypothetical protein